MSTLSIIASSIFISTFLYLIIKTLATKHEQTDIQNENQNNTGSDSAREENLSKRDVAYIGQQFELRDDDITNILITALFISFFIFLLFP